LLRPIHFQPGEISRALGVPLPELAKLNPTRTRSRVVASGTTLVLPKTFDASRRLLSKKLTIFPNLFLVDTSSWFPPRPSFSPLGAGGREATFGKFEFEDDPKHVGAIHILGDWAKKNVAPVQIPQLGGVRSGVSTSGRASGGRVEFFRRGHNQLRALFSAWESAGVIKAIQTWNGSFVRATSATTRTLTSKACASGAGQRRPTAWRRSATTPGERRSTSTPSEPPESAAGASGPDRLCTRAGGDRQPAWLLLGRAFRGDGGGRDALRDREAGLVRP
jgi:hypothetical protein